MDDGDDLYLLFSDDEELVAEGDVVPISAALKSYLQCIADKKLVAYKGIIHYGGKAGESLWTHLLNIIFIVEKVRTILHLTDDEMRCILLALTIHDINKIDAYGKRADGRNARYANAATEKNIAQELEALEVDSFFSAWRLFLADIAYLAHGHQVTTGQFSQIDARKSYRLDYFRLSGPLRNLMKFADAADNTHSGDYASHAETHIREKFVSHLNAALHAMGSPVRYRMVGHRLAELRGLETNVIHNEIKDMLLERYGKDACLDLLYRPEGIDYLLLETAPLPALSEIQHQLAVRLQKKFAAMQEKDLEQFIRATPSGISVDEAALQSGANDEQIFHLIVGIVEKKQYRDEWRSQRESLMRGDLEKAAAATTDTTLQEQMRIVLQDIHLLPVDNLALKRGELLNAYRNFIKEYRAEQLRSVKQDAWTRALLLFGLAPEYETLYTKIDPYRRGYFMARDVPERTLEEMSQLALNDLVALEREAEVALTKRTRSGKSRPEGSPEKISRQDLAIIDIEDYLARNLIVWDSRQKEPVQAARFIDVLSRYADPQRQHFQCCYCGSSLRAEEWMAIQVPPNIGVQSFSNRLEAGSLRDPKRNVCSVCRTQFILEKLAWPSHRDKQASEQVTFYLHLFPYSFFPSALLTAWWQSIERLRDSDHTALLIHSNTFFETWRDNYQDFHVKVSRSKLDGVGISSYADAISTTPILPLIMSGKNYSEQFLRILENTAILALWFDCRILLSRLPTPVVNLSNEAIAFSDGNGDGDHTEPVALLIENVPSQMSWLVPANALTRKDVDLLRTKLGILHQVARKLTGGGDDPIAVIHDLVSGAANDSLALYYEVDRLVERAVAQRKAKSPEHLAIDLTHDVAKLLAQLTPEIGGEM